MSDPKQIRGWFDRALGIAARLREAREDFNEMKDEDARGEMDWSRLRALAVAHDADLHDEKKHDRVKTMLGKGTYASWYADIVGIGQDEQNGHSRSSSPNESRGGRGPTSIVGAGSEEEMQPGPRDTDEGRSVATPGQEARCAPATAESGTAEVPAATVPSVSDDPNSIPELLRCRPNDPVWRQ